MRENLFEMGTDFGDSWESDNKKKRSPAKTSTCKEILSPEKHQLHFAKEKRRGKSLRSSNHSVLHPMISRACLKQ